MFKNEKKFAQLHWMSNLNVYAVRITLDIYQCLSLRHFFPFLYLFMWNCLPLIIVTKAYSAGNSMGVFHTKQK